MSLERPPTVNVIHGWGCTPTGDPPPEADAPRDQKPFCLPAQLRRGWRRTALYIILAVLMVLVFVNIALTLWIISALKLSMSSIGPISIVRGGIQLNGQAWVRDNLVASTITSRPAQPFTLHSYRNFTIDVVEPGFDEHSKIIIKRDKIECSGHTFNIKDAHGGDVFQASRDEVRVYAEALVVDGEGGINVKSSVQAPVVTAPPGANLSLESLTRQLELRASQSVFLESRAGSVDVRSHGNLKLESIVGAIKIDAPNIVLSNLTIAPLTTGPSQRGSVPRRPPRVYQVCACASGRLFLAAPDALCAAKDQDIELCR